MSEHPRRLEQRHAPSNITDLTPEERNILSLVRRRRTAMIHDALRAAAHP